MTKYKLEISRPVGGQQIPPVEFKEQIQEEAKAKSYKYLLDAADKYPDGEYVGKLYRKSFWRWEEVSAPIISCVVLNGKATLTVRRVQYNREYNLINKLKQHCNTLGSFLLQAANALLFSTSIDPEQAINIMDDAKLTFRTLLNDYRPEYLDASLYYHIESQINEAEQSLKSTFAAYAKSVIPDNYTTMLTADLEKVQLLLMSFIQHNNL